MAVDITYDSSNTFGGALSGSYTVGAGQSNYLVIVVALNGLGNSGWSATFGGTPMTLIGTPNNTSGNGAVFALSGVSSGTSTVAVNYTSAVAANTFFAVYSFYNAKQTSIPDNSNTGNLSQAGGTLNLTPHVTNTIMFGFGVGNNTAAMGFSTPALHTSGTSGSGAVGSCGAAISALQSTTSAFTFTASGGGSTSSVYVFSLAGLSSSPLTLTSSESSAVTDSLALQEIDSINKTDSTAVTDSVALTRFQGVQGDVTGNIIVSAYKWLTQTLLAAQQSYALRPYFTCQIIDDTIQPNAILKASAGLPTENGDFCEAPDGALLGAGFGGAGVTFYKSNTNLGAAGGNWDTSTLLDSSGGIFDGNGLNPVKIAVSDYVNGSYQIDIYYLDNFDQLDGASLEVVWQSSTDGGATWTKRTITTTYTVTGRHNTCVAAMKPVVINNLVQSGFYYIKPNGSTFTNSFLGYDVLYETFYNGVFSGAVIWSPEYVNSKDWTLQSIDGFYLNGQQFLTFSGFQNIVSASNNSGVANYGLWTTCFESITGSATTDIWSPPFSVLPSVANTPLNQNSFTFPVANVHNGIVTITFNATVTDSVAQTAQGASSAIVTTHTNYMQVTSSDGFNFTYPSTLVFSDGTEFTSSFTPKWNAFAYQNGYYYLGGEQIIWQFVQNNIVADVSSDVIQYGISEAAGQPASVNLQIANTNNKWFGNTPTNPGYQAIARNRKIAIQQGYYTQNQSTTEKVPRNIFYIDDILQSSASNQNSLTLTGRDFYKALKTTVTKFAFGWLGPSLYTDIFDGSTVGNWNFPSGNWAENSPNANAMQITTPAANVPNQDVSCVLASGFNTVPYGSLYIVNMKRPFDGTNEGIGHIYAYYIDPNNWLRIEFNDLAQTYTINSNTAGNITQQATGGVSMIGSGYYPIFIKQYDYYKFRFGYATGNATSGNVNQLAAYNGVVGLGGEIDMTITFQGSSSIQTPWTVGFGGNGYVAAFSFFRYMQYRPPNALKDLIQSLARKAGILSFKIQNLLEDYFFFPFQYTGTFTHPNRILTITAGNSATNNVGSQDVSNGEIAFYAKVASTGTPNGFTFFFRQGSDQYNFNIANNGTGIQCRFQRTFSSTTYTFPNSAFDFMSSGDSLDSLNLDLTKYHYYRIVFVDGWMFAFIDNIQVAAWNDNNTDTNYLTAGTWGWTASANTTLFIQSMASTSFWKQVPSFSLNPGDDVESAIESLTQSIRAWFFSSIMAEFKAIFLSSSDSSNYTYQDQLLASNVDQSDKEYVSQVTVFGNNVSATARNTTLMAGAAVRELTIVDYAITTATDAQTRANNELNNANQYLGQYNPQQTNNVGSEIFDVVTVVDTGNNNTGINAPSRIYSEAITVGGSSQTNDYQIQIDTGSP